MLAPFVLLHHLRRYMSRPNAPARIIRVHSRLSLPSATIPRALLDRGPFGSANELYFVCSAP